MITTNDSDIQVFGKFVESEPLQEQLAIAICPYAIPFSQRWGNNGMSADFIANYATKMFIDHPLAIGNKMWIKDINSSISFIANELLENAMKYSHYSYKYPIKFRVSIQGNIIRLLITNTVTQIAAKRLQEFINKLHVSDAMELYIHQLENEDLAQGNSSGLGLLTVINDYGAKLAWKFCTIKSEISSVVEITTMVELIIH